MSGYESEDVLDLLVIGGGVMGLFTAYHASAAFGRVAVLERGTIGDPLTASYGRTRSYRRDYLDPVYARFADEAIRLWTEFEAGTGTDVLVRCGCMNIATSSVTPDLANTYAQLSTDVLVRLGMPVDEFTTDEISDAIPLSHSGSRPAGRDRRPRRPRRRDRRAAAHAAGTQGRRPRTRRDHGCRRTSTAWSGSPPTSASSRRARSSITSGHGTNEVLSRLDGNALQVPITKDRPSEAKYFVPPPGTRAQFTSDVMPVIAYLDTGVYVHPIVEGVVDAVKVGYYNPPDIPRGRTGIEDIAHFVERCMPGLAGAEFSEVLDVDQCDYDLVADDDFVLGAVPGFDNVFVGVGWRGTGYKFAPWVGRVLFELALQDGTVYDIARFDPSRFTNGATP